MYIHHHHHHRVREDPSQELSNPAGQAMRSTGAQFQKAAESIAPAGADCLTEYGTESVHHLGFSLNLNPKPYTYIYDKTKSNSYIY